MQKSYPHPILKIKNEKIFIIKKIFIKKIYFDAILLLLLRQIKRILSS